MDGNQVAVLAALAAGYMAGIATVHYMSVRNRNNPLRMRRRDPGDGYRPFGADRRGVAALEYGIIAGVLGLVLIAIFKHFGTQLSTLFHTIGQSI